FMAMMIGSIVVIFANTGYIGIFIYSILPEWSTDIAVIITFWPWKILSCAYFEKKKPLQKVPSGGYLTDTLNNKQLLEAFLDFCKQERSEDNLVFWLQVEEFKKINDRHERKHAANKIFEEC